jgi:hypothetical protein
METQTDQQNIERKKFNIAYALFKAIDINEKGFNLTPSYSLINKPTIIIKTTKAEDNEIRRKHIFLSMLKLTLENQNNKKLIEEHIKGFKKYFKEDKDTLNKFEDVLISITLRV